MGMTTKFSQSQEKDGAVGSKFGQQPDALDGFYVIRGYDPEIDPLSSVMDLPKDEAVALMEKIHPHRGIGVADANGNRDQQLYHADRQQTDSWLRDNAPDGVKPERENPTFFRVTNDPAVVKQAIEDGAAGKGVMVAAVKDLDMSHWSFTFDDSMGNFFSTKGKSVFLEDKHDLHGTVMDAKDLAKAVTHHGTDLPDGKPRAIEGQYWSKTPLKTVPGSEPPKQTASAPKQQAKSGLRK
jgi:hypothetical protein